MEPAKTIISKLGGAAIVAQAAGVHRTRVYGWMREKQKGGTGGSIPLKAAMKLLPYAREKGIPLSSDDFMVPSEAAS